MIRAIRRRFMRIAISVLALAMVLVAVIINGANWVNVRGELYETLGFLGELNRGPQGQGPRGGLQSRRGIPSRHMRNMMNESRFFWVTVAEDGSCALSDTTHVSDEDAGSLAELATKALAGGRTSGFYGDYLFRVDGETGERVALFLNCETKLARVRSLALISAAACGGCILLAWLLVGLFSSRAIRPLVESAVQQKQFITDAGHELKTPLTVISANMDVLALETGENEWVRSTQKQVSGMRALVNELIYLSRLDEEDAIPQPERVDLSALVRETVEPFAGMAEFSGKSLELNVAEDLFLWGDRAMLGRLVSVLCDNAVKYAPAGDTISVSLREDGRRALLETENGVDKPLSRDTLDHLFDRFYRADASRSRESGGFGIGLSVARAIAERHGGDIRASQPAPDRLRFTVTLPREGRRGKGSSG